MLRKKYQKRYRIGMLCLVCLILQTLVPAVTVAAEDESETAENAPSFEVVIPADVSYGSETVQLDSTTGSVTVTIGQVVATLTNFSEGDNLTIAMESNNKGRLLNAVSNEQIPIDYIAVPLELAMEQTATVGNIAITEDNIAKKVSGSDDLEDNIDISDDNELWEADDDEEEDDESGQNNAAYVDANFGNEGTKVDANLGDDKGNQDSQTFEYGDDIIVVTVYREDVLQKGDGIGFIDGDNTKYYWCMDLSAKIWGKYATYAGTYTDTLTFYVNLSNSQDNIFVSEG